MCTYTEMMKPTSIELDDENCANRQSFHLPFGKESLVIQTGLNSASLKDTNFVLPPQDSSGQVSPSPSPKLKKWFPLSPASSCSTTPSLSEVEDDSMEMSQDLWESNFGINRAPWDAASDDQKDSGANAVDSFFFFVPSPVNESGSDIHQSMFHSSMFDDKADEMKEECWIEDDEDSIPVPPKLAQTCNEQTSKAVVSELQWQHASDRNSHRHLQFALQTGLETIHEDKHYGDYDNSVCSSCVSITDEALWEFLMPEALTDEADDFLNPTPQHHDPPILPVKNTFVKDHPTGFLTPEQQAAYDCLHALAFFLL
ncbi:hypothetical protein FisN_23Lh081 [Fistulifera solaris]|uniref:Uncharacterized protein n=1 Tax=Fistulifera solaris TaxID=1519565 RepID=A0A1Z5KM02_FISSO|nr:hypothetical protein FisN_23Lh081 [Fistulifera solaris]|eukprot:GAX27344.1 hypothetical protein FisN_23Lh081 [Fistulifera solaris]